MPKLGPLTLGSSVVELTDHAREILRTIAEHLSSAQTAQQRKDKSTGQVLEMDDGGTAAAAAHGADRHSLGFTLPQLTAEYRALRASVLRLWLPTVTTLTRSTSEVMARFHEGIDQALQESAIRFAESNDRARDTFLAIWGHDLRSPLATMTMAGAFLTREGEGTERPAQIGARVKRCASSMTTMVNDLLQYAGTELGRKMPVRPILGDMRDICQAAIDEVASAHPEYNFAMTCEGETIGDFDGARLFQVCCNLLNNAAQYRSGAEPVTLAARGDKDEMVVTVTNFGREIPRESLRAIFDPLVQLSVSPGQTGPASTSLGLGLFIAREITTAHRARSGWSPVPRAERFSQSNCPASVGAVSKLLARRLLKQHDELVNIIRLGQMGVEPRAHRLGPVALASPACRRDQSTCEPAGSWRMARARS